MLIALNVASLVIQLAAAAFALRLAWRNRSWSWYALACSMFFWAMIRGYHLADPSNAHMEAVQALVLAASTAALLGLGGIARERSRAARERRRTQQALSDSQERYRMLVENSPDAIYLHCDGRFGYVNPAAIGLFGARAAEDLIGQTVLDFFPAREHALILERRERLYAGVTIPPTEHHVLQPDGSEVPVEAQATWCTFEGRPAAQVVLHNLTERRRADLALRGSEERMRLLLDNSPTAVFAKDLDGRYIFFNRQGLEWTGRKVEEVLGRTDRELFGEAVGRLLTLHDRQVLEARMPIQFEEEVPHADRLHTHLTTKFLLLDAAGQPYAVCGVSVDIDDRKKMEEELRRSQEHYRQAAAYNQRLLQEVNHRVRNNLSSLLALLSLSRRRGADSREFAAGLEPRVMAMAQVHNRLAQTGWRDVDLRGLVLDLLALLQGTVPHDIPVYVDGPPTLLRPRQALPLAMTLMEMFTNSCKHGAHGSATGRLSVTWTTTPDAPGGRSERTVVRLTWDESGGPPPARAISPSLGTELIEGFINFEMAGRCRLSYPPTGAHHELEFAVGGEEPEDEEAGVAGWPALGESGVAGA